MARMNPVLSAVVVGLVGTAASAQCGGSTTKTAWQDEASCSSDAAPTAMVRQVNHVQSAPDIVDTAVAAGSFKTLVAAVKAAHLVDALKGDGPFTVFAPTDAAFNKLPDGTIETLLKSENRGLLQSILTYHVIPGEVLAKDVVGLRTATTLGGQRVDIRVKDGDVFIDGAKVTATDIETSNGVIHVIDTVIMPVTKSIPEVAEEAGSFGTLLKAVTTAGLADTLMGDRPFTVFAPTDEAFAKLGHTVTDLLKKENRHQLIDILTYHVVEGRVYATDAIKAGAAESLQGGNLMFGIEDAGLRVNNAEIISTDIEASNGVIHVIDSVLLPR